MAAITDSKQYENSQFTLKMGGDLFIFFIPERGGGGLIIPWKGLNRENTETLYLLNIWILWVLVAMLVY